MAGGLAFAETKSLVVSCTIPAIPGVNVPLIEEQSVRQAEVTQTEVIEEETKPMLLVKTLYDR